MPILRRDSLNMGLRDDRLGVIEGYMIGFVGERIGRVLVHRVAVHLLSGQLHRAIEGFLSLEQCCVGKF